jgi:hypothetical protein
MREYYQDERFCDHCDKYTEHTCKDDGHERDSSYDYEECNVCKYYSYGMSSEQSPP